MVDEGKSEKISRQLFDLLRQVGEELHPGQLSGLSVELDSSLDNDLGFDSLGRMELLRRLEERFEVRLGEQFLAEAETVRDLLRAILQADSGFEAGAPERMRVSDDGAAESAPARARTLIDVLDWHLAHQPDRTHVILYNDQGAGQELSYRQLHEGALRVAAKLQQLSLDPGSPVAIMLPSESSYFHAFWGIMLAGGIPVPIYPPARKSQMEDHLKRQIVILENCRASHLITMSEALLFGRLLKSSLPHLKSILTEDDFSGLDTDTFLPPRIEENDTAFFQYTSGSTGNPKGVILTHANLLANIRAMGQAIDADDTDVIVSWLPLYHDMGLIGCWLSSIYYANRLVLMSPLEFLARPLRWLHAIHRYRGTLSPAPNFAYEICLSRLPDEDLQGLDLSSWRCAFNGAEPVSPASIERFCERFAAYGFRAEAMMPVYGMAENSVGLAFPPLGREPLIDAVNRDVFSRSGYAEPAKDETDDSLRFVSCGQPIPRHEIRVVDRSGHELPERRTGRIQFRGPSACSGYFRNPEATSALFDGEWLDSGDLGYIAAGEIYITGRSKDMIIIAGRNVFPQELEEAVAELDGIRKGNVVVFGSLDHDSGTERLIVLAETRETDDAKKKELRAGINRIAVQLVGNPPHDIQLVSPKTIPKTSSGKLRRAAAGQLYEQNRLGRQRKLWQQYLQMARIGLAGQLRNTLQGLKGFAFTAWSWVLFYVLAPFAYFTVLLVPKSRWRWLALQRLVSLLAAGTGTPLRVEGMENLPQEPSILVANHASYLDAYALIATLPRPFGFVAKRELAANPLVRIPLQRLGTEFVERFDKQKGIEHARDLAKKVRSGNPLIFFPEGTFRRIPGVRPFHMGAFVAAAEADVPVVPTAIRGTRSMLRGDDKFSHPGTISIRIGPPIRGSDLYVEGSSGGSWGTALKLREQAREFILRHCGEPDLGRQKD